MIFLFGVAFTQGVAVGIYQVFPFDQIREVKKFFVYDKQTNILAKMLELRNNEFRRIDYLIKFYEAPISITL